MKRFLLIAIVLFAWPAMAQITAPVRIVVVGDSLTSGYMLGKGEDFASVLEHALILQKQNVTVVNMSVPGSTTEDGFNRMPRVLESVPDIAIIQLGMNDALRGLDVNKVIYTNIYKMGYLLGDKKIPYVILGIAAPSSRDKAYAEALTAAYFSLAKLTGMPLVPDILQPLAGKPELSLADGMHPNAAGVKAMVALVTPKILPYVSWTVRKKAAPVR